MTTSNIGANGTNITTSDAETKKRKSRAAIYSDDLRLLIIEEVYKNRLLWDTNNRDVTVLSASMRKKAFDEIALRLQSSNGSLKADDVERQWKNLKDTYIKVRKKLPLGENGLPTLPRWRFYRLLQFIDPDEKVSTVFDWSKELANMQKEQQQQMKSQQSNKSSSSSTSSSSINTSSSSQSSSHSTNDLMHNIMAILPNGIASNNKNGRQMAIAEAANIPIINLNPTSAPLSRLKRIHDNTLTYIRHEPTQHSHQLQHLHNGTGSLVSGGGALKKGIHEMGTNGTLHVNGINAASEDEYVIFCNSLVHPLRDIGEHNKLEYLKFKKMIHDTLYNVQSRIHSANQEAAQ